jgi:hypothetical protein
MKQPSTRIHASSSFSYSCFFFTSWTLASQLLAATAQLLS